MDPGEGFAGSIVALSGAHRRRMEEASWRPGCPVPLEELRSVSLRHWAFDGAIHDGEMIVHAAVADDVVRAFAAVFEARFPIERMEPIDRFDGDDDRSMSANNSTGFNGREVALEPGTWSRHAYGLAIDLNPVQNPYVRRDGSVRPPKAEPFLDRDRRAPGVIRAGDGVVRAFAEIGWGWGGDWEPHKDYQHFSATGD
jgi:hypothetical protein